MSIDIPQDEPQVSESVRLRLAEREAQRAILLESLKPKEVPLKEINSSYVNQTIAVEGKVVAISDPEIIPSESKIWRCTNCQRTYLVKTEVCDLGCGQFDFEKEPAGLEDLQIIKVHETKPKNNHIAKLVIAVRGADSMWRVRAGQKIKAVGMLRISEVQLSLDGKEKPLKRLEATEVKTLENTEVKLSEEDITKFKSDMEKPQFYEKILSSVAPHIHGMEAAKESGMLALASIGMRKPARMLWIGDPGVAKSELMEYFAEVSPNGHYTTMASSRFTGLTTTSEQDKETGKWMVTPGLFAHAHEGLVCIDELQVIREVDSKNLNDVIESGKIRYAQAGGNYGELDANCALIMACNPYQGKIFESENIQETLKFLGGGAPAFISRITLIYFFRDKVNEERDTNIAKAVVKNSGNNPLEGYEEDWIDNECPCGLEDCPSKTEYYGTNTLKKFFQYMTTIPILPVPVELQQELVEYYTKNRQDVAAKINKLLTPRFLRDAIKLAQVVARIQGQSKPAKPDIDKAMGLLANHMEETAFDPKSKAYDLNLINGSLGKGEIAKQDRKNQEEQFNEAYAMASKDKDYAEEKDIIAFLVIGCKWDETKAEKFVRPYLTKHPEHYYEKHGFAKWTKT